MWSSTSAGESKGLFPGRAVVGPLLIMLLTPIAAVTFVRTNMDPELDGSLVTMFRHLLADPVGFISSSFVMPTQRTLVFLVAFAAFEIALQLYLPGKTFRGPVTATNHVPVYKANGFQAFIATLAAWLVGAYYLKLWDPAIIYQEHQAITSTMCIFSFIFCAWLYVKGLTFPSSPDSGSSGNPIIDYYWGTELYPRIGSWDVKLFTNCRFGLMLWVLAPLSFAHAQIELYKKDPTGPQGLSYAMVVNIMLQLVYLAKFYWWETGYLASIDIMHDRAGYYICWGCLVWVPSFYVSHSSYLVRHSPAWTWWQAALIFAAGFACVFVNYDADRQRALARATQGRCIIWGEPARCLEVEYYAGKEGALVKRSTILLTSGWWSLARHFHYIPELGAAFFWALPAGFSHFMPYFYVSFLTILLIDRGYRDEGRCRAKYDNASGLYWQQYCKHVPYKFIPYIW